MCDLSPACIVRVILGDAQLRQEYMSKVLELYCQVTSIIAHMEISIHRKIQNEIIGSALGFVAIGPMKGRPILQKIRVT